MLFYPEQILSDLDSLTTLALRLEDHRIKYGGGRSLGPASVEKALFVDSLLKELYTKRLIALFGNTGSPREIHKAGVKVERRRHGKGFRTQVQAISGLT